MAGIRRSIGYNLARLVQPAGRETRASFWPYAIAIVLARIAAAILLVIPLIFDMMDRVMAYVRAHPEGIPKAVPGQPPVLPAELMPHLATLVVPSLIVSAVTILLLFSAVVRRLHDRGRTGWWAALPLLFSAIGMAMAPYLLRHVADFVSNSRLSLLSSLNGAAYWIALIVLIVMLVGEGEKGPNRFGPEPPASPD